MKNTKEVQNAIIKYLQEAGMSASELGKRLGVDPSSAVRWVNGSSSAIRYYHWSKLEPLISPYLNKSLRDQPSAYSDQEDFSTYPKALQKLITKFNSLDSPAKQKIAEDALNKLIKDLDILDKM